MGPPNPARPDADTPTSLIGRDPTRSSRNPEISRESDRTLKENMSSIRLLAIADSESYLKWAAHLLQALTDNHADASVDVAIIDSPIRPTAAQVQHAVAGTQWAHGRVRVLDGEQLTQELDESQPNVILAAATGPVVERIFSVAASRPQRPALVSGLPGMGMPATVKGQKYRRLGDLFIAHSEVEREAYAIAAERAGIGTRQAVARLPMLKSAGLPHIVSQHDHPVTTVVFATQAKVPVQRGQRRQILLALAEFARRDPDHRAILKVRSLPGEHETHREKHSFIEILDELVCDGVVPESAIDVMAGPMTDFLQPGTALVTVSSTAALESLDRGLPTLIIGDFGVTLRNLNKVFIGSGIIGSLFDVAAGRFQFAREEWLLDNYFQPRTEEVHAELSGLAKLASAGRLRSVPWAIEIYKLRRFRQQIRASAPRPVLRIYRKARKALRF